MSILKEKKMIENVENLFYTKENKKMKVIIKCAKRRNSEVEIKKSWQGKKKPVPMMLMGNICEDKTFDRTNRIIIHRELGNRNIQALYEDLGYLKEGEFDSYLVNL